MAGEDELLDTSPAALLEESAEDLYENAPCGYLSTLPDGIIIKVNQTFLSWTGFQREDLAGRRRFQELLTAGGRIFHETHYAPLLRMQGAVREIAVEIVCADGRRLPVLINSVLRQDRTGQPLLIRTTIFNATDRKEYERELLRARQRAEQADKAKAAFISMISHEIRTPLTAIMGVGELLTTTDLSAKQQKLVRALRSSSENLLNLVNQILDFSKIEGGMMSLEEKSFDLRQRVTEIVSNLRVKSDEKGLVLDTYIDERVPAVLLGDPVKIGQVLTNLVGNAIKFTPQGSVTVTLQIRELTSDAVVIHFRVTDTGIGISPDRLQHIFDDFTQASYDIGLKYGGTGLGLSISKRLVELHGSQLAVESELGRGTTFFFDLRLKLAPAAEGDTAEGAGDAGNSGDSPALKGMKVLVADDNEINVLVLTAVLRTWGIEPDVVTDGLQVVGRVQEQDYDVVLMDLWMPEQDGYAATRQIRSLPEEKFKRLPVIAVSASTRMGHQHELDAAGFTEFIGKPISPDILFAKLARYASRPA